MASKTGEAGNQRYRGDDRQLGLDILQLTEPSGDGHCAIVVEIWKTGVLLYSEPIARGTCVQIAIGEDRTIEGTVDSCEEDPYGHLIAVSINGAAGWFPEVYYPPYVLPSARGRSNAAGAGR